MVLQRNALVLAIALACLGNGTLIHAQTAPVSSASNAPQSDAPATSKSASSADSNKADESKKKATQLQVVQVQGFASSVQNAIATQRNSDQIIEAVSAEQIGKLPGISIADTLGRLPGLAVQTLGGRPQVLTIHGLGPDFSTAMINGREQATTSNNRDVQFDQYPSSWFNSVEVNLSPTASLVGQGLAGTVDMKTIQPLDEQHQVAAVNAHYIRNSQSNLSPGPDTGNQGYQVNGVYVNQFFDHTLGVTIGADIEDNPAQILHQAPWGYPNSTQGPLVAGGAKNYGISDMLNRKAVLTTLEYKPSDSFTSTLDMTYSRLNETQQAKGIEFPLAVWGQGVTLTPGTVNNGLIQSGTFDNVKAVIRNDYNSTRNQLWNIGWNNKFQFSKSWSAEMDASYSRADTKAMQLESYAGTGTNGSGATDTIGFNQMGNGLLYLQPGLNYDASQMVLTNPQGWGGGVDQVGFINQPRTTDYLANLRLSAQHDFFSGPLSDMQFGVVRGTRDKTYNINQEYLTLPNGAQTESIPSEALYNAADPLAFMGVGPQVTYNPIYLLDHGYYTILPTFMSSLPLPPNWKVRENTVTSYVQFNIDTHLGDIPMRGNVGIQAVHTNQNSQGERVVPDSSYVGQTSLVPVTGGTKYTRYLPSANLVFNVTDATDFRVGAARVLARPRMDQMNASLAVNGDITHLQSVNPNQAFFSASGGNAKLLPTMAENYNLSVEHYFSGPASGYKCNDNDAKTSDLCRSGDAAGYVSLSAYMIKLHDYIDDNAAYLYDFSAFVPSYLTPQQQQQLGTTNGIVSGPINDGHGDVKGVQGVLNMPFNIVIPQLDGLGVILSADYTKSSMVFSGNSTPITVPGLSRWVINNTLYYHWNGFEARVGQNYRSSFLGQVQGISSSRILQSIDGGSTYDAQISYTLPNGPYQGLTFILQGSNLTNKIFTTYQNNDPRQVLTWEQYGRRFDVGVSYKFR